MLVGGEEEALTFRTFGADEEEEEEEEKELLFFRTDHFLFRSFERARFRDDPPLVPLGFPRAFRLR